MNTEHIERITNQLNIPYKQVENTLRLLNEGATIPFISRYRKEATGQLDEVQISAIKDTAEHLQDVDKRRESIIEAIDSQGKLTKELKAQLQDTYDMRTLEDLYLPYKQKRKTRASIAIENGLQPLADELLKQTNANVQQLANQFVGKKVPTTDDALQGARDIIAEKINETRTARNIIRTMYEKEAVIISKVMPSKKEDAQKYTDYFDYTEPLQRCASHRLLALLRGAKDGLLSVHIKVEEEKAVNALKQRFVKTRSKAGQQVAMAVKDAYKRLLYPSIENEFQKLAKEKADAKSIQVFAANLRQLLLAPPLGKQRVLAIDPGFRTGCKVVCLDEQGNLLHNETIFPHQPQKQVKQAVRKIQSLISAYQTQAIAIGNGTASRETEHFIKKVPVNRNLQIFVVSEDGASIYSASSIAREEFPEYDVTVRGAISIGRRLLDPLAELIKIDPKSIGVGQYQHDINQQELQKSLERVVESCVNSVGVNVNTASKQLLMYVSGLGETLAQNIVEYRRENGAFASRSALKKVPRLGAKTFEQAAGFLRVPDAKNRLDNTAVHPESYYVVKKMCKLLNCTVDEIISKNELRKKIRPEQLVDEQTGLPTINDIMDELEKPGRDPRSTISVFEFDKNITNINNLKPGMVLPGIITNITNFGVFVDIGIKENGLVHISNLCDRFVSNPAEEVQLHQHVRVKVLEIDKERKRIQLAMKGVKQN